MNDVSTYLALAEGKPYKSFIKTINGKVYVTTLDIANETQTVGVILKGNQRAHEDSAIIDLWTEKQYQVFKRLNTNHIKSGTIVEFTRKSEQEEVAREIPMVEWSDEDLLSKVLKQKFLQFQTIIAKADSVVLLHRLLQIAKDNELTSKLTERIIARISELQGTPVKPEEV